MRSVGIPMRSQRRSLHDEGGAIVVEFDVPHRRIVEQVAIRVDRYGGTIIGHPKPRSRANQEPSIWKRAKNWQPPELEPIVTRELKKYIDSIVAIGTYHADARILVVDEFEIFMTAAKAFLEKHLPADVYVLELGYQSVRVSTATHAEIMASISLGVLDESDLYVFEPAGVRTVRLERNHRGASGMFECSLFLVESPRDLTPYLAGD